MSKIAIIGGGAAGLMLAANLNISSTGHEIVIFERGERVGRKLSATGNGQGNITNLHVTEGGYFSSNTFDVERANEMIRTYDNTHLKA
ncbi:MAG: NAD(P)/FAD-dependent oxidoreductase, partial [Clostridia bacterium]|nr:NAD(P)/FAD-dependent oxidoreductase [Clostridia bacterium]